MWLHLTDILNSFEPKDFFTLLIAAYGAILGTFNFVKSLRKDQRRLAIFHEPAFYTYADNSISTQKTSIKIANIGYRRVIVQAPTARMSDGKFLSFVDLQGLSNFPKTLDDGEAVSLTIDNAEIALNLKAKGYTGVVKMRLSCLDKIGNRYWGKKWLFDTRQYQINAPR